MKRRKLTLSEKVTILTRQAVCAECGEPLGLEFDWDHIQALGRDGTDTVDNIRAIHRKGCHSGKTRKDVKEIAKTRRLSKSEAAFRASLLTKEPGTSRERKGKIPSRPFPKRKPI